MNLASTSPEVGGRNADSGGLGFLDSTKSILELSLDLTPDSTPTSSSAGDAGRSEPAFAVRKGRSGKSKSALGGSAGNGNGVDSIEVRIQQDLGALKGRKGDTGESQPTIIISSMWTTSTYRS